MKEIILGSRKIDVRDTIISNIPWLLLTSAVIIFLFKGLNIIANMTNTNIQIIGLLGLLFLGHRFLSFVGRPVIVYSESGYRKMTIEY